MVATFFLAAALSKVVDANGSAPLSAEVLPTWAGWLRESWAVVGAIALEFALAIGLCLNRCRRLARVAAVLVASGFGVLFTAVYLSTGNADACGCFGAVSVSPAAHLLVLGGVALLIAHAAGDRPLTQG